MSVNNYSISRNERFYLLSEAGGFGVVGAVGDADCCRGINASLLAVVNNYPRPDKTGTRSSQLGILGRNSATWSMSQSLAGNGVSATPPDCGAILRAIFGVQGASGAGEVISGGTVTYKFLAANDILPIPSFTIFSFRKPGTLTQRLVEGAVVGEATFTLGQNIATWSASGTGIWCLDSDNFASPAAQLNAADINTQDGGGVTAIDGSPLGSFPTEPTVPVTNGQPTVGFTGLATLDGVAIAEIQSATIRIRTANAVATDTFGSYLPQLAEGGMREVSVAFTIYDNDGTGIQNLKNVATTQVPIAIVLTIGTVPFNTWTFNLGAGAGDLAQVVQLQPPAYDDSRNRFMCVFPESMSHASSLGATDELSLVIS